MPGPARTIMDRAQYIRDNNKRHRALAKARGHCIECRSELAEPGFTKCPDCRRINRMKYSR